MQQATFKKVESEYGPNTCLGFAFFFFAEVRRPFQFAGVSFEQQGAFLAFA